MGCSKLIEEIKKKYNGMKFTKEGLHSKTEKHSIQTSYVVHFKMKQAYGQLSHKQIWWVMARVWFDRIVSGWQLVKTYHSKFFIWGYEMVDAFKTEASNIVH